MNNLYYEQTEFTHEQRVTVNGLTYLLVGTFDDYNENTESYQVMAFDTEHEPYEIGTIKPIENGQYEIVGTFFDCVCGLAYYEPMNDLDKIVEFLATEHVEQLANAKQSLDWDSFVEYMADYGTFL